MPPCSGAGAERLDEYYAAGMRQLGFVHAGHNAYADSSRPMARNGDAASLWGGLSPLGRSLVPRLNDLGVILDVSQLSSAALAEVLALSRAPVIASHSAVRSRVDVPRNLTDDEIRAIAARGGVVHVVAFSSYLRPPPQQHERDLAALRARYGVSTDADVARLPPERAAAYTKESIELVRALPRADVADLVDAIDHVARLVGVEHVGIATDFEHAGGVDGYRNEGEGAERHPRAAQSRLLGRGRRPHLGWQLAARVPRGGAAAPPRTGGVTRRVPGPGAPRVRVQVSVKLDE